MAYASGLVEATQCLLAGGFQTWKVAEIAMLPKGRRDP